MVKQTQTLLLWYTPPWRRHQVRADWLSMTWLFTPRLVNWILSHVRKDQHWWVGSLVFRETVCADPPWVTRQSSVLKYCCSCYAVSWLVKPIRWYYPIFYFSNTRSNWLTLMFAAIWSLKAVPLCIIIAKATVEAMLNLWNAKSYFNWSRH